MLPLYIAKKCTFTGGKHSHFEWQVPSMAFMEISFNTYISRASVQQTSMHHTWPPAPSERCMPLEGLGLWKRIQGPDNTPPASLKLRDHKNYLANSVMDKNWIRMLEERTPILTQIKLESARAVTSLSVA